MRTKQDILTDKLTKEAWDKNWQENSTKEALEIFEYPRVKKQVQIYAEFMPKEDFVLEGGCGLGPYAVYYKNQGYKIIGLDYNFNPLLKIKEFKPAMPLVNGDVAKLPFKNNAFGAYLSLGVIEHFTEGPSGAIKEAFRLLKNNGYFIVQVPYFSIFRRINFPLSLLKNNPILRKIFKKDPNTHYWEQYFKIKELKKAFEDGGFKIIKIIPADHEHALMTFCGKLFREKSSYNAANGLAIKLGSLLEKYLPFSTADCIIYICKK